MPIATDMPILLGAAVGAVAVGGAVLSRGLFHPRSGLVCPIVWRGRPCGTGAQGRVALTFDDGPWPGSTEPILVALRKANARATFFVIGRYAREHPDMIRRIRDGGHAIGNHTYDHHRTGLLRGERYWTTQIAKTNDAIASATGVRPRLFRPPMGFKCPPQARAVSQLGHTVVAWSRRGRDGVRTTPARIMHAIGRINDGEIVLLHDGRDPASTRPVGVTAEALPAILHAVHEAGLAAVTVDDLITGPSDVGG
jgi:peptidoglycan-N-acetylglucosamine deacetylase